VWLHLQRLQPYILLMIVVAQLEVMANRLMDVVALGPGRGESRTVLVAMNQ